MTKLLYMEDMCALEFQAKVVQVIAFGDKWSLVLDQTMFYPQGGGQPYDTGVINSDNEQWNIEEVRFVDGEVMHIGSTKPGFNVGDSVSGKVDAQRRNLNSRLHSAGHVVDMAMDKMGISWKPAKGYHFPQGSYVEYVGELPDNVEDFRGRLEAVAREIVGDALDTSVRFVEKEDLHQLVRHVPDNLPDNKPIRVVLYGSFAVPCGGTHVSNLGEVGKFSVKKIKKEKDCIRVSYTIE